MASRLHELPIARADGPAGGLGSCVFSGHLAQQATSLAACSSERQYGFAFQTPSRIVHFLPVLASGLRQFVGQGQLLLFQYDAAPGRPSLSMAGSRRTASGRTPSTRKTPPPPPSPLSPPPRHFPLN